MNRSGFAALALLAVLICSPVIAQNSCTAEPSDLNVELRSATGSNHFQMGEVIPLEVLISSTAPKRYIEPCEMFWESCFGYPRCRFFTQWSLALIPDTGWADIWVPMVV